ncbi:Delta-1-pyrroline-5-carboxylate synthase 2, partial [Linum perenne]
ELDDVIDLVIPRGSNKLVSTIKTSTKIPILGHADGICQVYVDKSAKIDTAKPIVLDAKVNYPATYNAWETLLVHKDSVATSGLNELMVDLGSEGVVIYGGPMTSNELNIPGTTSLHHDAHTDCIIAEDSEVVETFLRQVNSAAVFHNASRIFCDGARFGLGAEVGISISRIHA